MSSIRKETTCNHVLVEDGGFEVCVKCAHVLGNTFTFPSEIVNRTYKKCEEIDLKIFKEKFSQIEELISRDVISNIVGENAKVLIKEWSKKKIPHQSYHHAYAVYIAARKNNFPISLKEIAYYLQIKIKDFCKIEKYLNYDFNDSPYDYLSKYCSLLELTYADEKIVKFFLSKHYKQSDKSPPHIAAGAIFATFPKINLQELTAISWIAPATIKKIATQLRARVFL